MHHRERRTETDIGDSGADRRRGQAALRFLASSVMSTDVRRHLWRGRGPLPRHVWAHVVVEWQMRSHHSPMFIDAGDWPARSVQHVAITECERGPAMEILDQLEMLVTSDPVAELDHALTYAVTRLRSARTSGDAEDARCILAWIDHRLDERLAFQQEMGATSSSRKLGTSDPR